MERINDEPDCDALRPFRARHDEIIICVCVDRLNFPLRTIQAGALSSARLKVVGVPSDVKGVAVLFTTTEGDTKFRAEGVKTVAGVWRVYCGPYCFPAAGTSLRYDVVAADEQDNPRWLGGGILNVLDCPADGSGDAPAILPRDTYIRNPVTGLYHKLVAETDESGVLTVAAEQEGVSSI